MYQEKSGNPGLHTYVHMLLTHISCDNPVQSLFKPGDDKNNASAHVLAIRKQGKYS
jgi:hypothetical protein